MSAPAANEGPVAKSFSQQLGQDIIKILVGFGNSAQEFRVHKQLLFDTAPAFRDISTPTKFEEGVPDRALLAEDDPYAFELFIGWLYRGIIDNAHSEVTQITLLIKLYSFAEKYGITKLQDNTLDSLRRLLDEGDILLTVENITSCYRRTHKKSKLRLLASRCYAYNTTNFANPQVWATGKLLPQGPYLDEVMADLLDVLRPKADFAPKAVHDPTVGLDCDYHQHDKKDPCPYTKKRKRGE